MPLHFVNESRDLYVEVRRRPIRPENIVRRPKIVMKDSEGNRVETLKRPKVFLGYDDQSGDPKYASPKMICPVCEGSSKTCDLCNGRGTIEFFSGYENVQTVNGAELGDEEEITYWAEMEDGSEEEFPKFDPSDILQVKLEIPKSKLNEFYIESWDELEAVWKKRKGEKVQDERAVQRLYEEAERYVVEGIMGAGKFVKAKGHQEWYFVCFPTIRDDGTFGWLVGYWQAKIEQKHLMPVPKAVELAEEKKTPAKSYLPDLQAIVG